MWTWPETVRVWSPSSGDRVARRPNDPMRSSAHRLPCASRPRRIDADGRRADEPSAPLAVTPDLGPALVVAASPVRYVAPSSAEEDVAVARTEESVGAGTAEEASLLTRATVVGGEAQPQDIVATPALDRYSARTGFQQLGGWLGFVV